MKILCLVISLMTIIFSSVAQPRYALVIGDADYTYGTSLRNPGNDAHTLALSLADCGFKVIVKVNLKLADFNTVIDEFYRTIKKTPCDALFFYSGHGIQHEGENYLIPVDANISSEGDIKYQCIPLQLILSKMEDANTRTNIIILDACRKDPFSKGWSKGNDKDGLAGISRTPSQSFIAFATAPLTVAADGKGANSPYTAAIAKYIGEPGKNIFEVFRLVSIEVRRQNPRQIPWNNYSLDNEFYFIATKDFQPGRRPMEFLVAEDCILYIDKNKIGNYPGGQKFKIPYDEGSHQIRVISQKDSSLYFDTIYNYNPASNAGDNLMIIPLNNKIIDITKIAPLLDSIKFSMVRVEGDFTMGTSAGNSDEGPAHLVHLDPYLISKFEVTQHQYAAIMGSNPSFYHDCPECPVENISWKDAEDFINTLNNLRGEHYRLPTEAEWEYAASGGNKSEHFKFSGSKKLETVGWFYGNSSGHPRNINTRRINELGISDMSGNVAEWCADWYGPSFYNQSARANPHGSDTGSEKIIRGGSWNDYEQFCRNSYRDKRAISFKDKTIGFRLAASIANQ